MEQNGTQWNVCTSLFYRQLVCLFQGVYGFRLIGGKSMRLPPTRVQPFRNRTKMPGFRMMFWKLEHSLVGHNFHHLNTRLVQYSNTYCIRNWKRHPQKVCYLDLSTIQMFVIQVPPCLVPGCKVGVNVNSLTLLMSTKGKSKGLWFM